MSVKGVLRSVQLPSHKPVGKGRVPVEDLVPALPPNETLANLPPESIRVPEGFLVMVKVTSRRPYAGVHWKAVSLRHFWRTLPSPGL